MGFSKHVHFLILVLYIKSTIVLRCPGRGSHKKSSPKRDWTFLRYCNFINCISNLDVTKSENISWVGHFGRKWPTKRVREGGGVCSKVTRCVRNVKSRLTSLMKTSNTTPEVFRARTGTKGYVINVRAYFRCFLDNFLYSRKHAKIICPSNVQTY